jgi:hypothetical protein
LRDRRADGERRASSQRLAPEALEAPQVVDVGGPPQLVGVIEGQANGVVVRVEQLVDELLQPADIR